MQMILSWDRAADLLGYPIERAEPVAGGDLSAVMRLHHATGTVIAKQGVAAIAEAEMVEAIRRTGAPAPKVLAASDDLLLLEDMPSGGKISRAWSSLADSLDRLHHITGAAYGWHRDHAFGPVAIPNGPTDHWPSFWADNRLRCHIPYIAPILGARIEKLADQLAEILPATPPAALLHGDLWGGNILVADDHVSALIDPACYHGDREVDFAMLSLFDHPPSAFYASCHLDAGWEARQPIYRLWPLLVHLRLFGDSYHSAVLDALAETRF